MTSSSFASSYVPANSLGTPRIHVGITFIQYQHFKMSNPNSTSQSPRELQLAPGIYFTPARHKSPHPPTTSTHPRAPHEMTLDELRSERDALVKSIEMLQASNKQMKEHDPQQQDAELVQAIGENIAIIARRSARAAILTQRIAQICPHAACEETDGQGQERERMDVEDAQADGGLFL